METTGYLRGYLREDFRLFHVRDQRALELEYHYHAFDKIVVFLSGAVTYLMEGTAYFLQPFDVLLVSHDQVHLPRIDPSIPYERIVLWINPAYLEQHTRGGDRLMQCFELARSRDFALLRLAPAQRPQLMKLLTQTEEACSSREFGHELLKSALFCSFMVELNRLFLAPSSAPKEACRRDETLSRLLSYINENLAADLSADALARQCYLSPSRLMHRFRELTGFPLHGYIQKKRLLHAADLLREGYSAAEAALQCGYGDYSAFLRAFRKMYGCRPREIRLLSAPNGLLARPEETT